MLKSISLKFTELSSPLRVPAQGVTVFVGPNNSGKSLVLRELEQDISSHPKIITKLLNDHEIEWITEEELDRDITNLVKKTPVGTSADHVNLGRFNLQGSLDAHTVQLSSLRGFVKNRTNERWVTSQFLRFYMIRLDGRTRFELTNDQRRGDLLGRAQNMSQHLFMEPETRRRVREIIHDAFNVYFTIEQLGAGSLRMRLSQTEPDADEQNWNERAREFHANALHIKEASDGVQAFVGIACAVLSGDYRAILIDEPEAFLHPPLARKLGYELTTNLKAGGTLMASTHSPDFLMGCLQASPNVRVVRLEYANEKSKGQIVDSGVLTQLFKKPLMRSANVVSALFHDGVVVAESDNDRVFYNEIYHRLSEQDKRYPSVLFVNAQNKQTIQDIIGPLRKFGIPAAAIVDIDILKDGGDTWTGWLKAVQIPEDLRNGYGVQRGNIHKKFVDSNIEMKTAGGVDAHALPAAVRSAANQLFDTLDDYGLFVVRKGELETWLKQLKAVGKKTDWTIDVLDKMGADPGKAGYLKPQSGDVWAFMHKIIAWIKNPDRKGTS
jgi:ABC-type cobalamin/Fe3+-siderophores transport system ATPase subunit